jgi:hypothetical protein
MMSHPAAAHHTAPPPPHHRRRHHGSVTLVLQRVDALSFTGARALQNTGRWLFYCCSPQCFQVQEMPRTGSCASTLLCSDVLLHPVVAGKSASAFDRGIRDCAAVKLLIASLLLTGLAAVAAGAAVRVDPSAGRDIVDCNMTNPCATLAFAISSRRAAVV